jgi:hypothetical protein
MLRGNSTDDDAESDDRAAGRALVAAASRLPIEGIRRSAP